MSKRYPGALITKTPVVPTSLSAPGIWSLSDQAAAQATNTWPFPRDPQFKNVTMLLHGDGSAGPVAATGVGAGVSTTVTNFNADASTNNFNVTINGDARSDRFTPYQEGYYSNYFNGSSYFQIASTSVLNMNTYACLECWVLLGSSGTQQLIIGRDSSYWLAYDFSTIGGASTKFVFAIYNGSAWQAVSSSTTPSVGTWYHIVGIKDNTTLRIYINGTQENTATFSGTPATGATPIGIASNQNNTNMTGYISNARFNFGSTSAALPYTANFTPSTTPLTAVTGTQLLTCQSNRFVDNSTNALSIPIAGTPQVSPAIPFTLPTTVATYGSGFFDGTGDSLSLASSSTALPTGTQDFSVEMYLYWQTQGGSYPQIISNPVTNGFQIYYDVSSGLLAVGIFNIANVITYTIAQTALSGVWTHLVVTRSGNTFRMFVNGVLRSNGTNTISFASLTTQYIASDGSRPYTGYMTDVRTVLGAIPTGYQTSSTTNGTSIFTPPTAPLTAVTSTALLTTQYNGGGNNSGFKDSSQFNFPITRNGNTTQGTFTPYGSNWSNYLNGSSNFTAGTTASNFLCTGSATGITATFEAWVFPTAYSTGGSSYLYSGIHTKGTTYFNFGIRDGAVRFYWYDGAQKYVDSASTSDVPLNTWTHIAVTISGATIKIYINGALSTTSATYTGVQSAGSGNTEYIGKENNGYYVNGYVSNYRLTNTVVYSAAFTPSTTPLTAVTGTQLLTCQSNRFIDNSSNAFTVTAVSAPSVQRFSPFAPLTVYNPATYGGSAYFDGSGDYLTTPQNAAFNLSTAAFTVEAFIYMTANNGSNMRIIGLGDGINGSPAYYSGWAFAVVSSLTALQFIKYDGTEYSTTTSYTFSLNTWYHVVAVRNSSSSFSMYVNGTRISNSTVTTSFNNVNSNALNLGYTYDGASPAGVKYFNGYISNARVVAGTAVYDPTLTTLTVPTAPLTAITGTSLLVSTTNAGILDNSMMNNLETVGNAAVSTSVKKYGAASMYFDGSGDYLTEPSSPNLGIGNIFTVECWLYLNVVPTSSNAMYVTDFRGGSTNNYAFGVINSGANTILYGYLGSTGGEVRGSTNITTSTWYHLAFVNTGSTLTGYLNGVSQGTLSASFSQGATNVVIGARYTGSTEYVNGYIDDLRITKGVARYTATFTVPDQAFPNG